MTWLLVTIRPEGSTRTPEPSDCWVCSRGPELLSEEAPEERVFHQRIAVRHHLGGGHRDDRRHHALDDRRVGHPQRLGRRRHHTVLRAGALRQQQRYGGKRGREQAEAIGMA
jgi:hypothetical protein